MRLDAGSIGMSFYHEPDISFDKHFTGIADEPARAGQQVRRVVFELNRSCDLGTVAFLLFMVFLFARFLALLFESGFNFFSSDEKPSMPRNLTAGLSIVAFESGRQAFERGVFIVRRFCITR